MEIFLEKRIPLSTEEIYEELFSAFPENMDLQGHISPGIDSSQKPFDLPTIIHPKPYEVDIHIGGQSVATLDLIPVDKNSSVTRIKINVEVVTQEVDQLLKIIQEFLNRISPQLDETQPPSHRRGPRSTPDKKKMEIINGWLEAQKKGDFTQEGYCRNKGIAPSTLRTWMRERNIH